MGIAVFAPTKFAFIFPQSTPEAVIAKGRTTGVRFLTGAVSVLFITMSDQLWGLPSLLSNEYRGLFPQGEKRPGCEAND